MNCLRSMWAQRAMAALLTASLLPVTFATAMEAAHHTTSYGDWLRTQLRAPADEVVEQALAKAEASKPRSLEGFLHAFVVAYEAQQPSTPAARAFAAVNLSNDALITYLQSRFLGFVSDAVLPRLVTWTAQAPASLLQERNAAAYVLPARFDLRQAVWATTVRRAAQPVFVWPLRYLFAAQPLGP